MNKYTYLDARNFMPFLAMLAMAVLLVGSAADRGFWTLPVAILIALVCDIQGVLETSSAVADRYMYPEIKPDFPPGMDFISGVRAVLPPFVCGPMFAYLWLGRTDTMLAAGVIFGHLLLVLLLGYGLGVLLKRKYRDTGEAVHKAKAMKKLDAVMAKLGMGATIQQDVRDSLADKMESDVYAAIDALKSMHKSCPAALKV